MYVLHVWINACVLQSMVCVDIDDAFFSIKAYIA